MGKLTKTSPSILRVSLLLSLTICLVSFSTRTYAGLLSDTTVFRIKVLQDTVYAGDTIDVEFYIGTGNGSLLNNLNLLTDFEMEIATDTSLILQDRTLFNFD